MIGQIFLHHHRQFGIVMQYRDGMLRAKPRVGQQGFRFDSGPV